MAAGSQHPKSIDVIVSEGDSLRLNPEALAEVLCQPEIEDKPLAVVGIAGPLRTGKSFALSFLMRYLRRKGWKNPTWIGNVDTCADDGIGWKGGRRPDTKGIRIWKEIFTVERDNGEDLAVLLVDTQGLFDTDMSPEQNSKIFTLTVLLCSCLMLNIKGQIDENILEKLQFFTEYARTATRESELEAPFQDVMFLVRDWQFAIDDPYGLEGGKTYLQDILKPTNRKELDAVRSGLRSTFEKIQCFLMPGPGDCVESPDFVGRNGELRPEFLKHVQELARSTLDPSSIKERRYNGRSMTGRDLWFLLRACNDAFETGEVPKVENMAAGLARARNRFACDEGVKIFKNKFSEEQESGKHSDLDEINLIAIDSALQHFEENTRFGGEDIRQEYRQSLISECQEHFKGLSAWDEYRKIRAKNFSWQKLHEIWTEYKSNMKESMKQEYQTDDNLEKFHRKHSSVAKLNYQTETAKEAAFHEDHLNLLTEDIDHAFTKLKAVNEERHILQALGKQDDMEPEYEGYLLLHQIAQQYREEFEKFNAMYIEEEKLKDQISQLQQSYHDIFETNWKREGPSVHSYRDSLLKLLREEYEDCVRQNERNKEVFRNSVKECAAKAEAKYHECMYPLIEKSYCQPSDLEKAHVRTVVELTGDIKVELGEIEISEQIEVVEDAEKSFQRQFKNLQGRNENNKQEKPPITWDVVQGKLLEAGKIAAAATVFIRQFTSTIRGLKTAHSAIATLLGANIVPAAETVTAAVPYIAIGAVAAAAAATVAVVAYCVYKHYENKRKAITDQ